MDEFCLTLNDLIVSAFRSILEIEERMLRSLGKLNLSIGEMHLIEVVGKGDPIGKTVSEIAKELSLSLPSVTVAAGKLEQKGFVKKARAMGDGRAVMISLTEQGQKIDRIHQRFHDNMVKSIADEMTEVEKQALLMGMKKMNRYLNRKTAHHV